MTDDRLKLVFMGTSGFAVSSLLKLIDSDYGVARVVSQPDRRKGRGRTLSPTPVKEAAEKYGLNLYQPENINSDEAVDEIKKEAPDIIVVVAYGQILKKRVLDIPRLACINIHASLLPELRGAAPINWAIINGDNKTGVTSMLMDEGMDTGDILLKSEVEIDDEMNSLELAEKLAVTGGEVLVKTLELIKDNRLKGTKQDESKATYAAILTKADGNISFKEKDAREIHNMVRGLLPWPAAHTSYNKRSLKILKTSYDLDYDMGSLKPGTVVVVTKESFFVAAKRGVVEVFSLQPQDKRVMPAADFINGYGLKKGAVLGA
jgi:methionyl-tRNA formyltransferase